MTDHVCKGQGVGVLLGLTDFFRQVKPPPPVPYRQYQAVWNTNQNQMKNACLFYIVFQVLKVVLLKSYKIQLPVLLILVVFYISFYASRYHFLQIFRTSLNII